MTPGTWSVSGLSVEFGIDRRTVAGRLRDLEPCDERGRTKLYRMKDAAPLLVEASQSGGDVAARERARKDAAMADKLELELARMQGDMVAASDVLTEWEELIGNARAKFLAVPHKLAPMVANEERVEVCRDLIERQVHAALDELAAGEGEEGMEGAAKSNGCAVGGHA
jgi:phage terminase Nu1 subunit (DNA packaging protein)